MSNVTFEMYRLKIVPDIKGGPVYVIPRLTIVNVGTQKSEVTTLPSWKEDIMPQWNIITNQIYVTVVAQIAIEQGDFFQPRKTSWWQVCWRIEL